MKGSEGQEMDWAYSAASGDDSGHRNRMCYDQVTSNSTGTYGFEYVVIFMLFVAQVRHVIGLPWQQQQPPLQWLFGPAIQVIPC